MPYKKGPPCKKCGKPNYGNGLCRIHYHHEWERRRRRLDVPGISFHQKAFGAHFVPNDVGCWEWTGKIDPEGYGHYSHLLAHRVSYYLAKGPIPAGLHIDHLCRNRSCVNPEHLEAVTPRVNWFRSGTASAVAARRSTCIHGHSYTPENTYVDPVKGYRVCRKCSALATQRYNAKKLQKGRR